MNPPTAEFNQQFWLWLALVTFVISNIAIIINAVVRRKQKREVSLEFTAASKTEFDQFTATTNANFVAVRQEIKEDRERNEIHASARSKTMFDKLESVRTQLDTKMEDNRAELGGKVDDVHSRINQLLSAVGELRGEVNRMKP